MNTNIYCINPEPADPEMGTVAIWSRDHSIWFNQLGQHWVFSFDTSLTAFTGLEDFLTFYGFQVCSQKQALLHLHKTQ